ncbi:MAG TPA: DUF493 family protein [Bacteroidales bacterium]|nr:DUF493 family protein [Bacteroidales bacterium]
MASLNLGSLDDKIIFPVTYVLKIVLDTHMLPMIQKEEMERLFLRVKVPFAFLSSRPSSKGNYVSYSVQVTLTDYEQMTQLYGDLRSLPGIKFAV